ncbi:MAG: GH3 auxin-responsive promoter family protein [bacterium]
METKTFNFIFVKYLRNFVYPGIQEELNHTEEIQKDLLRYLISTTKNTVFGKIHKFGTYTDHVYTNFISQVPVVNYDQYKEWIERAKQESDIIRPGKITRFSASAGTTSRKKHIPITDESLESINKAGLDTFATYATKYPETQAFGAYCRPLGGTIQEQLEDESIIGDVSALMILERSRMLQKKYKYPLEVFLEPNRYIKRDLFLQKLRPQEHTMMLGVTSRINEMLQYMEKKTPKKFSLFIKNLKLIVW